MKEFFVIIEQHPSLGIVVYGNTKGAPFTKEVDARRSMTMRKVTGVVRRVRK